MQSSYLEYNLALNIELLCILQAKASEQPFYMVLEKPRKLRGASKTPKR